jgi:hypothetical protein
VKFADPHTVTCPRCGDKGQYAVGALLSQEAECRSCGISFAEIGEGMHRQIKEVKTYTNAIRLVIEIEALDERIKIDDSELEKFSCLNDIIAATERNPSISSHAAAVEIVHKAIPRAFPGSDIPDGDSSLADFS